MFMSGVRWRVIRLSLAKWHIKAAETHMDRITQEKLKQWGQWCIELTGGSSRYWCEDVAGGLLIIDRSPDT
jgi:hypothetical protein